MVVMWLVHKEAIRKLPFLPITIWDGMIRFYLRAHNILKDPLNLLLLYPERLDSQRKSEDSSCKTFTCQAMAFVALVHAACEDGHGIDAERWFQVQNFSIKKHREL